ncbi:hypothetical protein O1611_g3820 [Lasiodiplodia mahajangana]|uniref:Uncharacterized protein n=1 Tax=Lasiodiplodia mahajangana TaxID=1108764 RepID=A0ACC2JRB8_9PEZI|nr:hypothetical protein O1611_g3820 [Lasiodiplodia mahajangana]
MDKSPTIARPGPGGFLPPQGSLPSPTPSTASSHVAALLPRPRSKPLAPGSKKEDYARDYVARRLLHISRRYVKKFGIPDPADEVTGYESMEEVCCDLDEVVDVLWFSGTPSLQVPYLLNVALAFNTYLPSFPPTPRPTFSFLRKIDHCFASLLVGYDVKTKIPLPGFSSTIDNIPKTRFSRTDMVRCKSIADETRMLVAMVMSGEVDVVDYVEDEVVTQRPARARTASRSESFEAPNSSSHGFRGIETIKAEEMEDDGDDDDLDFDVGSVDEGSIILTKRKAEGTAQDVAMADEVIKSKRIKVEDEGNSNEDLVGIMLTDASSNSPAIQNPKNDKKGQFHWALEEDDDDSSDDDQPSSPVASTKVPDTAAVNSNSMGWNGRLMNDDDGNEGGEILRDYEEADEDEDEELQMNVGQVYEKTIVQLGRSLGESIIDD